jgi:anti-anti-sigma factor
MPIEKWSDSVAVVHLADDPQFSEEMDAAAALSPACKSRVLDFGGVHFVNSSNIAALLRLRRVVYEQNAKLILCNVINQVWAAFLMTGLDKIFEFSENVPTALATIQMNGPENTGNPSAE